jgi:hypothetical protein
MVDMTVTEAARFQLRTAMGQILSTEAADTLMELLPATGWADVATKHDLDNMSTHFHREFEMLRLEMKTDLSEALLRQSRWFFSMLITVNAATVGLVFAAMKLL